MQIRYYEEVNVHQSRIILADAEEYQTMLSVYLETEKIL